VDYNCLPRMVCCGQLQEGRELTGCLA